MYGVCGRTLNWFESYLPNRKQTCKVNNIFSEMRQTKTGVPQGSNLEPLLFLTYVNDLPNCLGNASASMFADDTNITATGQTVQELQTNLNNNLENVHHWLLANRLTLNYNKTEYMIIGSRQKILNIQEEPLISIGNETIMFRFNYCQNMPGLFHDYFKQNNAPHKHNTRNSTKLHMSYKRTNYRKYTIFHKGILIWNVLNEEIKNTKTYYSFKKKAKFHYLMM